jgi:hypothetical protein
MDPSGTGKQQILQKSNQARLRVVENRCGRNFESVPTRKQTSYRKSKKNPKKSSFRKIFEHFKFPNFLRKSEFFKGFRKSLCTSNNSRRILI